MTEVLDLDSVFARDTVKLNGNEYELRNQQEFGILDDHKLRSLIDKIQQFQSGADTEEDAVKASALLRDLATMLVVDLSDEVPDWACVAIFEFWMQRAQGEAPANPPKPAARRTTASSSRNSKPRTAAVPKRGSTSRRTN